ncbi:uncharacterized protein RSE6_01832 [Rhynchosporium secalis]|uniref:Uncharacterized protein n=1 Tax=Rhynchosporium secalis TaxID=38038 RepID=A0A1E1LYS5_RHYSE|nr:uncharacterized protein RSE6_01832 [Rhynchosporium secalis]
MARERQVYLPNELHLPRHLRRPSAKFDRPSLSIVDEPLFHEFTTIDLAKSTTVDISKCLPPLHLKVPRISPPITDASHIIFGRQTTLSRLRDTMKHMERWLPHTNARLFAIVIENDEKAADNKTTAALENDFHSKGMSVSIIHPVSRKDTFERNFSLTTIRSSPACTNYKPYSPNTTPAEKNTSALSEDWWAVNQYGLMGFGGAGIFLSFPLAEVISEHKRTNFNRTHAPQQDT